MELEIEQQLTILQQMTVKQLKQKFEDLFCEVCRSHHKAWLVKRIIWRIQADTEGDLSQRARQHALKIANDSDLRTKAPKQQIPVSQSAITTRGKLVTSHDPRIPLPGTILTREYKGQTVEVAVLPDCFSYQGEIYKSLSAVAKAITGTHTNGFLFFQLNDKKASQ